MAGNPEEKILMNREIEDFFLSRATAVVGASSSKKKSGNIVYSDLREKGRVRSSALEIGCLEVGNK